MTQEQFTLSSKMRKEGLTIICVWGGGLKKVERQVVEKNVQSVHRISVTALQSYLTTPVPGFNKDGKEWLELSETNRVFRHLADYIHDQKSRGNLKSWYVQEQN